MRLKTGQQESDRRGTTAGRENPLNYEGLPGRSDHAVITTTARRRTRDCAWVNGRKPLLYTLPPFDWGVGGGRASRGDQDDRVQPLDCAQDGNSVAPIPVAPRARR
jgi:hypothetical protein